MTASDLRTQAYQARALKSIGTIEDAEDYSAIMNLWVSDMVRKKMPVEVQTAILQACEEKRQMVAKLSGVL